MTEKGGRLWTVALLAAGLVAVTALPVHANGDEDIGKVKQALSKSKISLAKGVEIAVAATKGKAYEAECELEDDGVEIEVKVLVGNAIKEVEIDGVTGKVTEIEDESDEDVAEVRRGLSLSKVSLAKAIKIAEGATKGKAYEVEGELEDDGVEIEVKVLVGDVIKEVEIDGVTGKIKEIEVESPTKAKTRADTSDEVAEVRQALSKSKISLARAIAIAEAATKGKAYEAECELEDDGVEIEVKVLVGDVIKEVEIDGVTGKVTEIEEESTAAEPARSEKSNPAAKAGAPLSQPLLLRFDKDEVGTLPAGWKIEATNLKGALGQWRIVADPSAPSKPNVLALVKPTTKKGLLDWGWSRTFNLCWTDRIGFKDGTIELSFKANSGKEDQGGGPIWRAKDANNYYVCRANPLESNFRVYFVKDASRKTLASARVKILPQKWQTIKVEHRGDHIQCWLNGRKLLEVRDKTFTEAGGVGLWTKADAATSFDNFKVVP